MVRRAGRRFSSRRAAAGLAGAVVAGLVLLAGCGGSASPTGAGHLSPAAADNPLTVISVTPRPGRPGAPGLSPAARVTVRFSAALAANTTLPRFSPAVAGSWRRVRADTLAFRPTAGFPLGAKVELNVPAGIRARDGGRLGRGVVRYFQVRAPSLLRLQQLLAEQGYLPLRFVPDRAQGTSRLAQLRDAANPPAGSFVWKWGGDLPGLAGLWSPDTDNVLTRGAVMAFEYDHGLPTDGVAGPAVWQALINAQVAGATDPAPYSYVYVVKGSPEELHLYENGQLTFTTYVNTGIAAAPTADGTFPIYARFLVTTMTGTEPDGQHYSDPGIPWTSYFNGGDALHGFIRSSYGWPQSLGCVEMPFPDAHTVFEATNYGTLVTVTE